MEAFKTAYKAWEAMVRMEAPWAAREAAWEAYTKARDALPSTLATTTRHYGLDTQPMAVA